MDLKGIVTGEYAVCLVLYVANESGAYVDIDAIYTAFIFEVRDGSNKLKIALAHANWGYVKFPDTKLLN